MRMPQAMKDLGKGLFSRFIDKSNASKKAEKAEKHADKKHINKKSKNNMEQAPRASDAMTTMSAEKTKILDEKTRGVEDVEADENVTAADVKIQMRM